MYIKEILNNFEKDGYKVSLPNVDFKNISICFVEINNNRKSYCKIKNSPIFYYIIEGDGIFMIDNDLKVKQGDLLEIATNKKYTYKGNLKMLEIIPNSFENLSIEEDLIN